LSRILQIILACKILSVFELGRIANIKYYDINNKESPKIGDLLNKLAKLGINRIGTNLLLPSLQLAEVNSLETNYKTALDQEAYLLSYARRVFFSKGLAEEMTLYRQPSADSLAINKFDLFGHAGRRNRIRIIVECNLRREVTPPDLEGFCQRVGGTIKRSKLRKKLTDRSPIARYYIGRSFSESAKAFAKQKNKGIRLVNADLIPRWVINEISPYEVSKTKPPYYGRFKELRGLAFEAEIEPAYQSMGFKTRRRQKYYLLGNEVSEIDTGKSLTDVDLIAERGNGKREIVLVECKCSAETISRKKLFQKVKKYELIAAYIQKKDPSSDIKIEIIANVSKIDQDELLRKCKYRLSFFGTS
jgi:hypothetical protein